MVENFVAEREAAEQKTDGDRAGMEPQAISPNWLDINQNCDYESLSITKVSEHTGLILRFRMAAISSALIALFLMPEEGCGAAGGGDSFRGIGFGCFRI